MEITEFNGIQQYHDGRPVADYCNMIPMTNSVIDRQGEILINDVYADKNNPVIETFVDSDGNIYIARAYSLELAQYIGDGRIQKLGQNLLTFGTPISKASFAESASKPSQVYFCNGVDVYYWNIRDAEVPADPQWADRFLAFKPIKLPLFSDLSTLKINGVSLADYCLVLSNNTTDTIYEFAPEDGYTDGSPIIVDSITWFDNRLVLVQQSKNTVWLSNIDISRFIVPTVKTANGQYRPMFPWQVNTLPVGDEPAVITNELLAAYYASTASAASLQDAIAFGGSLYFLNDSTIEVWSATGNVDNPIQHNSQNTLYYGGRSPVIIDDTLYLICKGAIHNDFIVGIHQSGQMKVLSNPEIERRIQTGAFRIRPLSVRDMSQIIVYTDDSYVNGYAITKDGKWWRYWNNSDRAINWSIVNKDGHIFGISVDGSILEMVDDSRLHADGKPIVRSITGGFLQFAKRQILRDVELVCDTGIYYDANLQHRPELFLRVSFDRGHNYGPYLYRKFGASGSNDRVIIWRNCGSGNSMLIQFGTSNNVRFQLYGIRFNLA